MRTRRRIRARVEPRRGMILLASLLLMAPLAARAQLHCSQLPPLTPEAQFPRCTTSELAEAGYPDHMHAEHWPGWQVLVDEQGRPYGPGSICHGKALTGRDDVRILADEKQVGPFIMRHNQGYKDCDMLPFLELMEWAAHTVPGLLGLTVDDTLMILNPDNTRQYQEQTGQGTWRLYALQGNTATIEPYPILLARTLDAHAAFMLYTDWLLRRNLGRRLPRWLHDGLVEYVAEDGIHLNNYMAEFRAKGPVLMSPPLVNAILAKGVDSDPGTDRENFRRARYSAFVMVWQLVENEGGLEPLRDFLGRAAAGENLDQACTLAYGVDLAGLAKMLDPASLGEPAGKALAPRHPQVQP